MATLLGTPLDFEFGGKVYKVHPRDLDDESVFAASCRQWTLDEIQADAPKMLPGVLSAMLDGHRHDIASHFYEFRSFIPQRALQSEWGQKKMALIQLGKKDPTVTTSLVNRIWKDDAKRQELLMKMRQANGEDQDPNAQQPSEAGDPGEEPSPAG
jgi:hypothetical protein